VVVITRDRRDSLLATLPRHEAPVILVDNASGDGTVGELRRRMPHVTVVPLSRNLGAVARNVGVRLARTPYVAFADDDSWWQPGALARAVSRLSADPGIGLLAGRVLVGSQLRTDPVSHQMAVAPLGRYGAAGLPRILGFLACGAVVRRDAFLAAGGFDPVVHFPGEEERLAIDLAALGWELVYDEGVEVRHEPAQRVGSDPFSRQRLIARNSLLTGVMRRPWSLVGAQLVADLAAGGPRRAGVWAAVPRLPAALRERRIVAPVEEALRTLSAATP
jgi:GT2 family glycosyltransferase